MLEDWNNSLSDVEGNRPINGDSFRVIFHCRGNGSSKQAEVSFSKVSGIRKGNKTEYIVEGGNDKPLMFDMPKDSGLQLTFERGFVDTTFLKRIPEYVARLNTIEILVYNGNKNLQSIYWFVLQGLVEYSLGDLRGDSSEVLIEKLVVSTTGINKFDTEPIV